MASWDWSHGNVSAGNPVTVNVRSAPCQPVVVKLLVGGQAVDEGQIQHVPGSVVLDVPAGSSGQSFEIIVACDSQSSSKQGTVA